MTGCPKLNPDGTLPLPHESAVVLSNNDIQGGCGREMMSRISVVVFILAVFLAAPPAEAKKNGRNEMSDGCKRQCRVVKRANDGYQTGFRYKHSDIGGGVVALTNEFNRKARFLEANNCRVIETTAYFGVANGGRHHYYTARGKSGAGSPAELARKAQKKGNTKQGYFQVGDICYGPFNLGNQLD